MGVTNDLCDTDPGLTTRGASPWFDALVCSRYVIANGIDTDWFRASATHDLRRRKEVAAWSAWLFGARAVSGRRPATPAGQKARR